MRDDSDFNYRKLTPEQWAELTHRVRREAHAARARSLQTLCWAVLVALRSAGAAGRRLSGRLVRLLVGGSVTPAKTGKLASTSKPNGPSARISTR